MAYYIYSIAVRWPNGDLEGFRASALDKDHAQARAVSKAANKQREFRIPRVFQVLDSSDFAMLSVDEQDSIQLDWDTEQEKGSV